MFDGFCVRHPAVALEPVDGSCRACIGQLPPDIGKESKGGRRPFIEITRTKKMETQLTRIACALEQLLIEAYGYHTEIPTTDTSGPDPQVYYTDHDEHDIRDIVDEVEER